MESITKFFKEEKAPFFRRRQENGKMDGRREEAVAIAREMNKDGISFSF